MTSQGRRKKTAVHRTRRDFFLSSSATAVIMDDGSYFLLRSDFIPTKVEWK